MKSMPMPPYSGGRWGAQSPSDLTSSWTRWRRALASARWASVASLPRPCESRDSLGRILSLTMRAVRRRMSLMWSLSPSMGVTLMGMARSPVSASVPVGTLRGLGGPLRPGDPAAGEGPLVAAMPDEADDPTGQGAEAVLEAGQEGDVHAEPQQPPDEAADAHRADLGHGGEARDDGERPEVAVVERLCRLGVQGPHDGVGGMGARLHCRLGHARQVVGVRHQVAHHEQLGMARQRAVGADHDPAGLV